MREIPMTMLCTPSPAEFGKNESWSRRAQRGTPQKRARCMMRWSSMLLSLAGLALHPALAQAQSSPESPARTGKPVLIIVPNAPGGGPDLIARLIAPRLSEALRQNVIVENRASANGIVGTELAARAAPDGSVIAFGNAGTHAINATLYKKLPYDPVRDFAPVSELASAALVTVAHPAVPAKSVKELVALARKAPGKLNIAIAGAVLGQGQARSREVPKNHTRVRHAAELSSVQREVGRRADPCIRPVKAGQAYF
jgi:hypothetical protein